MRFWASPFPLDAALAERLRHVGMLPWSRREQVPGSVLVLYDTPHALLGTPSASATVDTLKAGLLLSLRHADQGMRTVAIPRLASLSGSDLTRWLAGEAPSSPPDPLPDPTALQALFTLVVLEARPDLLVAYRNLELKADLLGGPMDRDYLGRLRRVVKETDPDRLLCEWHRPVLDRVDHRFALMATTRRLRKVQARERRMRRSLTMVRMTEAERSRQLATSRTLLAERQLLQDETERALAHARAECEDLRRRLDEARQDGEQLRQSSSLREDQFRQIQDELEQYYLQHHRYRWLCQEVQREMRRAELLLSDVR